MSENSEGLPHISCLSFFSQNTKRLCRLQPLPALPRRQWQAPAGPYSSYPNFKSSSTSLPFIFSRLNDPERFIKVTRKYSTASSSLSSHYLSSPLSSLWGQRSCQARNSQLPRSICCPHRRWRADEYHSHLQAFNQSHLGRDLRHVRPLAPMRPRSLLSFISLHSSKVRQSSVIAVQIFDHRKFKKRDQGLFSR